MKQTHFSIKEVLSKGWEGWKLNWQLLLGVVAMCFFLGSVPNLGTAFFKNSPIAENIFQAIGMILGSYASLGLTNVTLKIAKKEIATISDFFDTFSYFFRYFFGQILFYIVVSLGLILLIVPGIILGLKFYLYPYYIIEKGMGIVDSFKASNRAVYGAKSNLFLFAIVEFCILLLGIICLLVGLFVAIPVVTIAQAAIYKTLQSQIEMHE